MLMLLLLIPWVLTVVALLVIIAKSKTKNGDDEFMEENGEIVKVAMYEDKAYWVHENIFYQADLVREPDFSTAKPIDTMSLSPRQLDELLVILDELEDSGKE